ncbi:MAG: hypothetical protein DHS20C11_07200 [Lysobacteraceae bacterium]|nr:MAG: hypothetical protein DHS20C11_07200 [Xanthomonadaceae bacterium]
MSESTERNAFVVLKALSLSKDSDGNSFPVEAEKLAADTKLQPGTLNTVATILVDSGLAEWRQWLGTSPFHFGEINLTPRGRYELERAEAGVHENPTDDVSAASLPPSPVGSPYGFTDHDWEIVAQAKGNSRQLNVVLGYQFVSDHYDSDQLKVNLEDMFKGAVDSYQAKPGALKFSLNFRALAAGYGEHLFNEIARDIIAADIAIFDTSDLNPNVMVEMGVALTWGVRVLPIKRKGCAKPPSDISGQTWADYSDSAYTFADPDHGEKVVRMVERAIRKKG